MFPFPRFLRVAFLLACVLPCAGSAQTASVTTLHSLVGPTNGVSPRASLVLGRDGNFYGTTQGGGPAEEGTIFVVTPAGRLTTLYSFGALTGPVNTNLVNADGATPTAGLIQGRDGNFYGTTSAGGAYGYGTVFSITPGGTLSTVHSFSSSEGAYQSTLRPTADGRFYGVAQLGGAYNNGTIFVLSSAGTLTTLHDFTNEEGRSPQGALVPDDAGNLYGTLSDGGPWIGGAVFSMTPAGVVTILHNFTGRDGDGSKPVAGLARERNGNFYGTTTQGGDTGQGTVYKVTPDGTVTTLHSFDPSQGGASPNSALFLAADGSFYGTTNGAAFKITADGQFTILARLNGYSGGPDQGGSGLVAGTDGNFYGTLSYASASGGGLVYTLTPAGVVTILHPFDQRGNEVDSPRGLTQGSDGNFYGTTSRGGAAGWGTGYVMSPAGVLQTLHAFSNTDDGYSPQGALLQARDGKFYGVAPHGYGTEGSVFSLTPAGSVTTVCRFSNDQINAGDPYGALVQENDGTLYGTTYLGGGGGTVFALGLTGTLTTLHGFNGSDGSEPYAGLTLGSDGKLYGVTTIGGTANRGTVFVTTTAGAFQTLHSFTGNTSGGTGGTSDGASPYGELVQGGDGNFYGTTNGGGNYGNGTVFVLTPAGALTAYHFAGPDGAGPNGTLLRASDGSFYGTTRAGGLYNLGAVYRLTPGSTAPATSNAPDAQIGGAHPDTVTQSDNGDAFTLSVANVGTANTGGTVTVRVTAGSGSSLADVSGPGWTCARNGTGWTCTRADLLGVGHSYPALTALVNVSPDAPATGTLTSHVAATGDTHAANDTSTDRFAINAAASTPTQRWRYRYFGTTANRGVAADTANPAGDGIPNLLKYALGQDPTTAEVSAVTVDTSTGYLRLTAPKNPDATDLTYAVQVSAGLLAEGQGWTTDGTVPLQNTATLLQVRDATLLAYRRKMLSLEESPEAADLTPTEWRLLDGGDVYFKSGSHWRLACKAVLPRFSVACGAFADPEAENLGLPRTLNPTLDDRRWRVAPLRDERG